MTLIEIISVSIATVSALLAWIAYRRVRKAYDDSAQTIQWLLNKLEKNRYDARKEYDETGWAPKSDGRPDSE